MRYPSCTLLRPSTTGTSLLIALVAAGQAMAVDYTWDGGSTTSNNWSVVENWVGDSGYPLGHNDRAIFGDPSGVDQPLYQGFANNDAPDIVFNQAGWTISGSRVMDFGFEGGGGDDNGIISNGAGLNQITTSFVWNSRDTINTGTGNTLFINSSSIRIERTLDKSGDGTLILAGTANTGGMGPLRVSGGTMLVNYDTTPITLPRFSVDNGTLGGSGTLNVAAITDNDVQVRVGAGGSGTLAPGGDGSSEGGSIIGTFSVNFASTGTGNSVTMYDGSVFAVDLSATDGLSDLLDITVEGLATDGYLSIGADVTLALYGPASLPGGNSYNIASFANTEAVDYGAFSTITYNGGSVDGFLDVIYTTNGISISVIPEPQHFALLFAGLVLAGLCWRRSRKSFASGLSA